MKLLNFLGAIGLMLGATTNIHNIKPNVLKSQNRQVQRANQELFSVFTEYSIVMDYVPTNVFNSYDFVVFDLDTRDVWQTDSLSNKSGWVQDDITNSYQALYFNDYHNYLINRNVTYDYVELNFNFSLGSQSQYQDNYIYVVLFTFDDNNNFVQIAIEQFDNLYFSGSSIERNDCFWSIYDEFSLDNLYLGIEYWSQDKSVGNIKVSFETDIYIETDDEFVVTEIPNFTYNYFIFNNSEVANDNYDNGYDNGFSDGVEDGRQTGYNEGYQNGYQAGVNSQENLQLQIEDLTNQLNAEKTKVNNLQNQLDSAKALQSTFDILTQAFNPVIEFFKIQITPNINIGSILLIPVSVAIILFLLKALIL